MLVTLPADSGNTLVALCSRTGKSRRDGLHPEIFVQIHARAEVMGYPGEVWSRTTMSRGDGVPPGKLVQGQERAGVMLVPSKTCKSRVDGVPRGGLIKDKKE